jgi:hypothetical protein
MKYLICLLLLLSDRALANCENIYVRVANIAVHQIYSTHAQSCFLSINPIQVKDLVYRTYSFSVDGDFLIFTSYGDGPESTTTGDRELYFFPRTNKISFVFNDSDRRLEVTHVNGDVLYFSYDTAKLVGSNRGVFTVADDIKIGDRGGIIVQNYDGLMLDAGFLLGNAPTTKPERKSFFRDQHSNECQVDNADLFDYENENGVTFRLNDSSLQAFLKEKCPQLTWPQ